MKRALIIEDEYISANRLKRMISDIDDTFEVVGPLTSVDEVVENLRRQNDYDLVFADIRLGRQDVFEAFRKVMPRSFVIFITAYNEYAMEAIKSNGIDYLMKPIDHEELAVAMEKVKLALPQGYGEKLESLAALANQVRTWRERFLVSKGDELVPLKTDDISFIYKDANQTKAFTPKGDSYILSLTMNDLEQQLNPDKFFRLNRQYIANINYVKKISVFFSNKLSVRIQGCDDAHVYVSKERSAKFKEWLDR